MPLKGSCHLSDKSPNDDRVSPPREDVGGLQHTAPQRGVWFRLELQWCLRFLVELCEPPN
jgi:hypothetical protein